MARHVLVQAAFQFSLLLAILLTGVGWLGVSTAFLDSTGIPFHQSVVFHVSSRT